MRSASPSADHGGDAGLCFADLNVGFLGADHFPEGILGHVEHDIQVIILVHRDLLDQMGQDHLFRVVVRTVKFFRPVADHPVLRGEVFRAPPYRASIMKGRKGS